MSGLPLGNWLELLAAGLREDDWGWDFTTQGSVRGRRVARARVVAKEPGVFFGAGLARAAERWAVDEGFALSVRALRRDGARLRRGDEVFAFRGDARAILALERPLLNLAAYGSGIATRTAGLVALVRAACPRGGTPPRVTSTRKTLPHYRDLGVRAVVAGGGHPHRVSLSGGVLIKENHIRAAGSIARAVAGARAAAPHTLRIEVEVTDLAELRQALRAEADAVMLDNFTPGDVRAGLAVIARATGPGRRPRVEVSGGIREETIARYALPGVDLVSVGSLTHGVRALDLSLLFHVGR